MNLPALIVSVFAWAIAWRFASIILGRIDDLTMVVLFAAALAAYLIIDRLPLDRWRWRFGRWWRDEW